MKKSVQLDLKITQSTTKKKHLQVQPWVNKALDAKNNLKKVPNTKSSSMLEISLSFRKSILDLR
jgi:hypothetical protein